MRTFQKAFSADGQYIVHERLEGGHGEVVVRSTDGRDEIPLSPGRSPHWDIVRNRIYYQNEAGTVLYRVDVQTDPTFDQLGKPEEVLRFPLFERYVFDSANNAVYSVSIWSVNLDGPDAILNVIQHFDRYAASLVDGSN